MKLFIIAALVTVCAAGRLEHLERAYLPPHQGSAGQFGSQGPSTFGSSFGGSVGSNGFRSSGSLGGHGFGSSGSFDSNGIGAPARLRGSGSFGSSAFPGATINQYLPPDHGPSGASGSHFGSSQGFGSGNQRSQYSQFGSASQYSPSSQYGAPSTFGSQGQFSQFPATSRQYLAPKASSSYPQQPFDEETDYHHGYETENGIKAEESGNPTQAQGGFSYKGDDGIIYTITYTSGEGGFRPEGEHLPIAPPTPEAILEALQKNAEDEAKGIFDDGKYRPDAHDGSAGNSNHQNGFKPNSGYTY